MEQVKEGLQLQLAKENHICLLPKFFHRRKPKRWTLTNLKIFASFFRV